MSLDQAVVVIEVSSFSILTKYTRVCTLAAFYLSWLLGDQLFIFLSLPQKLFVRLKEAEQPSNFSLGICWFCVRLLVILSLCLCFMLVHIQLNV